MYRIDGLIGCLPCLISALIGVNPSTFILSLTAPPNCAVCCALSLVLLSSVFEALHSTILPGVECLLVPIPIQLSSDAFAASAS